jgi:hypothetical protein
MNASIQPYFTADEINQLAEESGFLQRCTGKIDGTIFLNLILANRESLKYQSLDRMCIFLSQHFNVDMKKQSLHERFNNTAVAFLKNALEKLLAKQIIKEKLIANINGFSRILIKDSTCFQISENLKGLFPGCGGTGSDATVRIQFEFEILSGSISDLKMTAYTTQDATDSITTVEYIKPGELIIRDLGYIHSGFLKKVIEKGAFFGCRLQPSCAVYEIKGQEKVLLDFVKLRAFMVEHKINFLEKNVIIGVDQPLCVRLIVSLLPDDIAAQRITRLTEKQRRKGKGRNQLSKKYTARCFFNLFVTNASEEQIPKDALCTLYKFRWLIELVFKTWKSTWRIHEIKKVNEYRFQCYVYAKLIMIIVSWRLTWCLINNSNKIMMGGLPSIDKCNKLLSSNVDHLFNIFCGCVEKSEAFIKLICIHVNLLLAERHSKRPTQLQQVAFWGGLNVESN